MRVSMMSVVRGPFNSKLLWLTAVVFRKMDNAIWTAFRPYCRFQGRISVMDPESRKVGQCNAIHNRKPTRLARSEVRLVDV